MQFSNALCYHELRLDVLIALLDTFPDAPLSLTLFSSLHFLYYSNVC
jgi:hypothetical protein